jgi:hypothetical protein
VPYRELSKVICEFEYRVAIRVGGEEHIGVGSGDDEGSGDEGDGESKSSSSVWNNDGRLIEADELFLRSLAGRFGGGETEYAYEEDMAVNSQEHMSHVETRSYIVNAFFCGGASKRVMLTRISLNFVRRHGSLARYRLLTELACFTTTTTNDIRHVQ